MASLNRIILIGNLVADPELQYTASGTARTRFRLAVNRQYKNREGQLQEETTFVNIVAWGSQAENCAQFLQKGRLAAVDGRLRIYSFDTDEGEKKYMTEVVASNVQFLGGRGGRDTDDAGTVDEESSGPAPSDDDKEEVPF
jgi:single-strand DNA-binding protein